MMSLEEDLPKIVHLTIPLELFRRIEAANYDLVSSCIAEFVPADYILEQKHQSWTSMFYCLDPLAMLHSRSFCASVPMM